MTTHHHKQGVQHSNGRPHRQARRDTDHDEAFVPIVAPDDRDAANPVGPDDRNVENREPRER